MKYRTKLYTALVGTAVVSTSLGLGIAYYEVKGFFIDQLRSKVMSIAAAGAANLDGDLFETIHSNDSPNYQKAQQELRKIRDASRRKDVFVKFVYTLIPRPEDPERFFFQVDAEEPTPDFSYYNDEVPDAKDDKVSAHINDVFAPPNFIENEWGTWMTGFAPIYDSQCKYVATLGVDLRASDVLAELRQLLRFGAVSFGAALLLALLSAHFLSRRETLSLNSLCAGVKEIGEGNLSARVNLATRDEFDDLAKAINIMAKGLEERERLKLSFTRYVSQHIMESILKSETPVKLEGERRKITLLFSDIRQFTKLSEKMRPEDVVAFLNEYFGLMVDVIFKNKGTLDKFIGDGMMIEFGAPLADPDQEFHAVTTAIEMQQELQKLCQKWESEGKPRINMGIGIHTGDAVVGNIGSEKRIEYTAVGDAVNVAARLEQLTKEIKIPILVSETTVKAVEKQFPFKALGPMTLHGRADTIVVYGLDNSWSKESAE
jgi:adenylate cyclase